MKQSIQTQIDTHHIVVFMKGTKAHPFCGFSATVVHIFNKLGAPFKDIDILADPVLREELKVFSAWPTFPQVYIKGTFIGGCDIVKEMYLSGELQDII